MQLLFKLCAFHRLLAIPSYVFICYVYSTIYRSLRLYNPATLYRMTQTAYYNEVFPINLVAT